MNRVAIVFLSILLLPIACGAAKKTVKSGPLVVAAPSATPTPYVGQKRRMRPRDREEIHILQVNAAVATQSLEQAKMAMAKSYHLDGEWEVDLEDGLFTYRGPGTPTSISGTAESRPR